MALPYSFRLAVSSILHEKWINLLSVLTIAAGLLFTSITLLSLYNIHTATKKLPEKFSVMIYLKDNLTPEQVENIVSSARQEPAVFKATHIPKDMAMKELKATLKDTEYLLDGLMENPLPDAIEIKLKSDSFAPENIKSLTSKLSQIQGVHEIEYGEKILSSILTLRTGISTVGLIFIVIMAAGMIFVCYSTVKILFYRKNIEIETYKLLGATKGFIRAPFVIEGAVIGGLGGIMSLIVIFLVYYSVIHRLSLTFALFKAIIFPVEIVLTLPLVGLFLGITGALIAIGRIRY